MSQFEVLKNELYKIAKADKNTYFVYMDSAGNILFDEFKKEFGNRVICCGISEQNAVSLSGGLALQGKKVYLFAPAIFVTTRAFEQMRVDVAYNNANVTVIGTQAGSNQPALAGYSHWAIEDIALMRTLPNMSVVCPSSEEQCKYFMTYSQKHSGPMYVRIDLPYEPCVSDTAPIKLGKMSKLVDGKDFAIIATGYMVNFGASLVTHYNEKNIFPLLLSAHSLRPFDEEKLLEIIDKKMPIVTLEDHGVGGLASIVAEIAAKHGKMIKFLPIFADCNKTNIVGDFSCLSCKMMGLDKTIDKIDNLLGNKVFRHICPLRSKTVFNGVQRHKTVYSLFGIVPLLKIKYRKNTSKKPSKYYLFGFLRVR